MIARWLGIGVAVAALLVAGTELSCLADDLLSTAPGESASVRPASPADLPVDFEVDHTAPGAHPVLTR